MKHIRNNFTGKNINRNFVNKNFTNKNFINKNFAARRILLLAVLLPAFLLSAVSCGIKTADYSQSEETKQQNAVTIWAWDENYNIIAAQEAVKAYQKRHPNAAFEIVSMSQEEIVARLKSAMLTGSRKSLPDIALIEDYRIQDFLQNYESEFLPLNGMILESDFAACKTGVNRIGSTIYGVPFDSGTVGLFYRLDMIEEAGFSEKDMQDLTWEEYIEIGIQVREKTGRAMLTMNPSDLPVIRMMLQSAGVWYSGQGGRLDLEGNAALAEALRLYQKMIASGIVLTAADWNQFIRGFQDAKVATVLSGSWISASIIEQKSQSGLWRVAAVPRMQNVPGSVNASSVGGSGWYILKYGGNAKAAKQFLGETFASDTGLINLLAEKINLVSTLKAAENSENYKKGQAFYGNQMIYQDFIRWTYEIPEVNYGTDTYGMEVIVAEALQQILSGGGIEETLSDYQRKYE